MFEHDFFGNVAERYVFELDFAPPLNVSGGIVGFMIVFPRPFARVLVRLDDIAVFILFCVDESDITVVSFGLLVDEFEYTFRTGKSHKDAVHLLRYL